MANEPLQLDREASLMLYAAGEMPAAEKAQFDAQLAADPALAGELQRVREAMQQMEARLSQLDDRQRPPVSDSVAIRRVERTMQQWAADRLRPAAPGLKAPPRMPWWAYPAAMAACLIIGFLVWSGRQPIPAVPADPQAKGNLMMADAEALADRLDDEFEPVEIASDAGSQATDELDAFFIHPSEVASW